MSKREEAMRRRLRAVELMQQGATPAAAAKAVGVARQTAYVWKGQVERGEFERLYFNSRGPRSRLDENQLGALIASLGEGARARGFDDDRWTLKRIGALIERDYGVRFSETHIWRLLGARGIRLTRDGVLTLTDAAVSLP
jgi:transposase